YLNVSDNELTVLPPNLPAKLKYLNVNSNQLKELPAHFPNKLLFLDIDNNPIIMGHVPLSVTDIEIKQGAQLPELSRSKGELILEWSEWLVRAPANEMVGRKTPLIEWLIVFVRKNDPLIYQT
ncbi:MAG TPA: hypothetical protein ACHBY4_10100, partial [Arsenophonus apicola]